MASTTLLPEGGKPTPFQKASAERLSEVLRKRGLESTPLVLGEGSPTWYWTTFRFGDNDYRLEIYPEIVVMHQGDRYFEPYMPAEFESETALIEGFASRLDRYLSGGPWAGPDEKSFGESLTERLRHLFQRDHS